MLLKLNLPNGEGDNSAFTTAMALQPDGKIIAAGTYHLPDEYYGDLTVVRLLPDGIVDSTFGTNGTVMPAVKGYSLAVDMALQSDGKIVIGGINRSLNTDVFFMERLLPNGMPDSSFAQKGKLNSKLSTLNSLAIQPDDKILSAGDITNPAGIPTGILIRRYLPDGSPDLSFGKNGTVDTLLSNRYESHLYDIALQPDGKIVGAGSYDGVHGFPEALLTRYLPSGTIDKSFGIEGVVRFPYLAYLKKVLLWKDRIMVAGTKLPSYTTNSSDFLIAFYFNDGRIDSSFSTDGLLVNDCKYSDNLLSAVLQSDGKIVLSGESQSMNGNFYASGLSRYYGHPAQSISGGREWNPVVTMSPAVPAVYLYPNPARDYLYVKGLDTKSRTTIAITDGIGKTIAVYDIGNASQYKCDISKLTADIYYLQVQTLLKAELLKFVKE